MSTKPQGDSTERDDDGTPPRYAPGRAEDAVDWVGGIGWQHPESGHLQIVVILAIHHDQACTLHRCHQIAAEILEKDGVKESVPETVSIIAMPVKPDVGDTIHRQLAANEENGSPTRRRMTRIGLGTKPCGDVPLHFRVHSVTAPDGHLTEPIRAEEFATLDRNGRLIGTIDAGEPELDFSNLEAEPVFVAGAGMARTHPTARIPTILRVLAIGQTPAEAASRGLTIFEKAKLSENRNLMLKVRRVSRLDGQMIRMAMEGALESGNESEGEQVALKLALGRSDHLVPEWVDVPEEMQRRVTGDKPAQVTMDSSGAAQLWEPDTTTEPYWAETVQ